MKPWLHISLFLVGACLSGCQSGGNTDLLRQENRLLEDRVFELQSQVDEMTRMLDKCDRENTRLLEDRGKKLKADNRRSPTPARPPRTERKPSPQRKPPQVEMDETEEEEDAEDADSKDEPVLKPPEVEMLEDDSALHRPAPDRRHSTAAPPAFRRGAPSGVARRPWRSAPKPEEPAAPPPKTASPKPGDRPVWAPYR